MHGVYLVDHPLPRDPCAVGPKETVFDIDPRVPGLVGPIDQKTVPVGIFLAQGGHHIREETNGQQIFFQADDLDKDGIWDELFFMVDIKARETKTMYLYIEKAERGLYKHKTHAGIGYYGRHMVPFWETEYMGWKLWFPTSVDLHGKREPMLTAYPEYSENLSGYYMPYKYGSDIMRVGSTFGNGGIGLFEVPAEPDSVSRPPYDYNTDEGPFFSPRCCKRPVEEYGTSKNNELEHRFRSVRTRTTLYSVRT